MRDLLRLKTEIATLRKQSLLAPPSNSAVPQHSAPIPSIADKPQSTENQSESQVENAAQGEPQVGEKRLSDETVDP